MADSQSKLTLVIEAVDRASAKFDAFTGKIQNLIGAFALAFAAKKAVDLLVNTISAAVDAASSQEQADVKLSNALKNLGGDYSKALVAAKAFASQQQQVTKYADDQIEEVQALLAAIGGLRDRGLESATKAALDFAAATGTEATAAATLLGKAAAGNTTMLGRYGIIIDESIPKSQRFAEALRIIAERFGGAAEAAGASFEGRMTQAKNAFGDVLEEIGNIIIKSPELLAALQSITRSFSQLATYLASNDVRAAFGDMLEFLTGVANKAAKAVFVISFATAGFGEFGDKIRAGILVGVHALDQLSGSMQAVGDKRQLLENLQNMVKLNMATPETLERIKQLEVELGIRLPESVGAAVRAATEFKEAYEGPSVFTPKNLADLLGFSGVEDGMELLKGKMIGLFEEETALTEAQRDAQRQAYLESERMYDTMVQTARVLDATSGTWHTIWETNKRNADEIEKAKLAQERHNAKIAFGAELAADLGAQLVHAAIMGDFAFGKFMKSLIASLAAAVVKALILAIILTSVGGGSFTAAAFSANFSKALVGVQTGGQVMGTTRGRDSVLALLEPGEVVVRNPVVQEVERRLLSREDAGARAGTRGDPGAGGNTFSVENNFNYVPNRKNVEEFLREQNELVKRFGFTVYATKVVT